MSEATRVKYDRVREQISLMHQVVSSMLNIAQNMETRSMALSTDMKQFAANMTLVSIPCTCICGLYMLITMSCNCN